MSAVTTATISDITLRLHRRYLNHIIVTKSSPKHNRLFAPIGLPLLKISQKFVHDFLNDVVPTDRKKNYGNNINSTADKTNK